MITRVAISTDSGKVSDHFGRCPEFTIAKIENKKVISKKVIQNPGHSTGFLPNFFSGMNVQIVIAGGAGFRAKELFEEKGIELILGVSGKVDDVLNAFLKKALESNKEGFCLPGKGKGYGIKKEDGHETK
jgi:predicted Fe-Mo cluster-binding NifX family protein